jgi:hypothetical protein
MIITYLVGALFLVAAVVHLFVSSKLASLTGRGALGRTINDLLGL